MRAVSSHRDEVMWGGRWGGQEIAAVALPVLPAFLSGGRIVGQAIHKISSRSSPFQLFRRVYRAPRPKTGAPDSLVCVV